LNAVQSKPKLPSQRLREVLRFDPTLLLESFLERIADLFGNRCGSSLNESRRVVSGNQHGETQRRRLNRHGSAATRKGDLLTRSAQTRPASTTCRTTIARGRRGGGGRTKAVADVRLLVLGHQGQKVQIEVQPIREDLVKSLKSYVFDGDDPKRFTTGVFDQDDI
jgi:hypothetical protein